MVIYDVDYREKGKKLAEVKSVTVCGMNRESCKLIAQAKIGEKNTIIKMVKVG